MTIRARAFPKIQQGRLRIYADSHVQALFCSDRPGVYDRWAAPSHAIVVNFAENATTQEDKPYTALVRELCERLTTEHPHISTDPERCGGVPHLKSVRLTVGDVLAKLYVHGSIDAVVGIYSDFIDREQVKDAIAYAQDFLEESCASR